MLRAIQAAYSQAVTNVLYFSLAAIAVAMPFALCMEWKNMKGSDVQAIDGAEHQNMDKSSSSIRRQGAVDPEKP